MNPSSIKGGCAVWALLGIRTSHIGNAEYSDGTALDNTALVRKQRGGARNRAASAVRQIALVIGGRTRLLAGRG